VAVDVLVEPDGEARARGQSAAEAQTDSAHAASSPTEGEGFKGEPPGSSDESNATRPYGPRSTRRLPMGSVRRRACRCRASRSARRDVRQHEVESRRRVRVACGAAAAAGGIAVEGEAHALQQKRQRASATGEGGTSCGRTKFDSLGPVAAAGRARALLVVAVEEHGQALAARAPARLRGRRLRRSEGQTRSFSPTGWCRMPAAHSPLAAGAVEVEPHAGSAQSPVICRPMPPRAHTRAGKGHARS
jgi:hypothetical protein